jgi:hypothetical protein
LPLIRPIGGNIIEEGATSVVSEMFGLWLTT